LQALAERAEADVKAGGVVTSEMSHVFISFVHEQQDVAEAVQRFIEEVLGVNWELRRLFPVTGGLYSLRSMA
jgi:pyruvate kinase